MTDTLKTAMRVLVAGGGTGGHLFPGVALAEAIKDGGGTILFVGTANGIEAKVLPEEGWPLELISVAGIKGRGISGFVRGVGRLPRAYVQSRQILRKFAPDVVVGVGGYASGPVVASAALSRIPTAILEQNSIPGITNRILGRLVDRIFTTFDHTRGFPPSKVVQTGNPIRKRLVERLVDAARTERTPGPPRLFVFGGSQGASALNRAVTESLRVLVDRVPGIEIHHQTGTRDHESVRAAYDQVLPGARVDAFIRDMSEPYASCDLVVCRAGATSLAELSAVGCPALLVPFPHATDDHQTHNAQALVDRGAALMLRESELQGTRLADEIATLLSDPPRLQHMREAMRAASRPHAAADIARELATLVAG